MTVIQGIHTSEVAHVTDLDKVGQGQSSSLDETTPEVRIDSADIKGLPVLDTPARPLSVEKLLTAIANEQRRNGIRAAVDQIEQHGYEVQNENAKKLEEIAKQIDKKENMSIWDKIRNAFRYIGMALGLIAGAITTAVGAITGNALMIVAGVAAMVLTLDSVVSEATDGKVGISAGLTKLGEACGMSSDTAKWFGFGLNMALTVVSVAISFGAAGAARAVTAGTEAAAKVSQATGLLAKASTVSNFSEGITGIGTGVSGAVVASYEKQIADSQAKQVDIDAILEGLRNQTKMLEEFVKHETELASNLMQDVMNIIENCGDAATAVLTNQPATA